MVRASKSNDGGSQKAEDYLRNNAQQLKNSVKNKLTELKNLEKEINSRIPKPTRPAPTECETPKIEYTGKYKKIDECVSPHFPVNPTPKEPLSNTCKMRNTCTEVNLQISFNGETRTLPHNGGVPCFNISTYVQKNNDGSETRQKKFGPPKCTGDGINNVKLTKGYN